MRAFTFGKGIILSFTLRRLPHEMSNRRDKNSVAATRRVGRGYTRRVKGSLTGETRRGCRRVRIMQAFSVADVRQVDR